MIKNSTWINGKTAAAYNNIAASGRSSTSVKTKKMVDLIEDLKVEIDKEEDLRYYSKPDFSAPGYRYSEGRNSYKTQVFIIAFEGLTMWIGSNRDSLSKEFILRQTPEGGISTASARQGIESFRALNSFDKYHFLYMDAATGKVYKSLDSFLFHVIGLHNRALVAAKKINAKASTKKIVNKTAK